MFDETQALPTNQAEALGLQDLEEKLIRLLESPDASTQLASMIAFKIVSIDYTPANSTITEPLKGSDWYSAREGAIAAVGQAFLAHIDSLDEKITSTTEPANNEQKAFFAAWLRWGLPHLIKPKHRNESIPAGKPYPTGSGDEEYNAQKNLLDLLTSYFSSDDGKKYFAEKVAKAITHSEKLSKDGKLDLTDRTQVFEAVIAAFGLDFIAFMETDGASKGYGDEYAIGTHNAQRAFSAAWRRYGLPELSDYPDKTQTRFIP